MPIKKQLKLFHYITPPFLVHDKMGNVHKSTFAA